LIAPNTAVTTAWIRDPLPLHGFMPARRTGGRPITAVMPGGVSRRHGERSSTMIDQKDTILTVQGMTCGSCVRHVTAALKELDGVGAVEVKLRDGLVVVKHDATEAPVDQLIDALRDAGYDAQAKPV
jgi:copper chaperone